MSHILLARTRAALLAASISLLVAPLTLPAQASVHPVPPPVANAARLESALAEIRSGAVAPAARDELVEEFVKLTDRRQTARQQPSPPKCASSSTMARCTSALA